MILPWNSAFLKGEFWKVNLVFFNLWFWILPNYIFPRRLPLLGGRALWCFFRHEALARNMGWTTYNDVDRTFWWRTIPLLSSPLWPAASLSILLIHDCKAPVQYSGRQRTTTMEPFHGEQFPRCLPLSEAKSSWCFHNHEVCAPDIGGTMDENDNGTF
jgi:hypothetical protein